MRVSVFDIFKVGIGPSSSHTVGPMRAAVLFTNALERHGLTDRVASIRVDLYGSLGLTGKGHGTDKAVLLGLEGETPEHVDPDSVEGRLDRIRHDRAVTLPCGRAVRLDPAVDLVFRRKKSLPLHPNGMTFVAYAEPCVRSETESGEGEMGVAAAQESAPTETASTETAPRGEPLLERTYYSVGGGFIHDDHGDRPAAAKGLVDADVPFPFATGDELLAVTAASGLSIADVMLANEGFRHPDQDVRGRILEIWATMQACIARGCREEGILPGGLKIRRRATKLLRDLVDTHDAIPDPLRALDWVNLWALAVNEENAAGGRVVTAPTNGAAGVVPAVLSYYVKYCADADTDAARDDGIVRFLLAAAAVGALFKENASISGAEVGCQGEVGVACAMAAAGLAEALGATPAQVENAAEIGMEHNLGLTCDPVGGLVQVPCIERNAMGAVKAINAARMAMLGDGAHFISLDRVIRTMRATGRDMKKKYKETSRGGLAVNVVEC